MKKAFKWLIIFTIILSFVAVLSVSGCKATVSTTAAAETTAAAKVYNVTFALPISDHPVWSEDFKQMQLYSEELGGVINISMLGADNDSNLQITQLENLIQSKADAIIFCAVDVNSLTNIIQKAKDAGVVTMSFGYDIPNTNTKFLVPNYDTGIAIGTAAAQWINDKLGGTAEVGLINLPMSQDIIDRENGIKDALKEGAPNANIVVTASALNVTEGQTAGENFLQKNPNMKVICSIGDGGGIGANEAVKAAGKITPDFGIFCADATVEALQKIKDKEAIRTDISLGTSKERAKLMIDILLKIFRGEDYPPAFYTPVIPVNAENLEAYIKEAGLTLK